MKTVLLAFSLAAAVAAASACDYEPILTCQPYSATGCSKLQYCCQYYSCYWDADGTHFLCEDTLCQGAHSESIAFCESKKN